MTGGTPEERLALAVWALEYHAWIGSGRRLGLSSTAIVLALVSGQEHRGNWPLDWGDALGNVETWRRLPAWALPRATDLVTEGIRRVHEYRPDDARRAQLLRAIGVDP